MKRGLGTQLRHLIELLDGAVGAAYDAEGLAYRPRYTPLMRALHERDGAGIGELAELAGISQPAATQTVALMIQDDLVSSERGPVDGRQRVIRLTPHGRALMPRLQACWQATATAAAALDADLTMPLSQLVDEALQALQRESFGQRIQSARAAAQEAVPVPGKKTTQ
jgi:DNA-binding MarR family transcriptional regulator